MKANYFILFLSLLAISTLQLSAQSDLEISLESFSEGLERPVALTHSGDDRLFAVEQPGRIRIINSNGQLLNPPFLDIRSRVNNQGNERGLLGLVFHPNYSSNGYFYVNYTGSGGATRLSRFQVDSNNPNAALANSEKILLTVDQPFSNHNGGDLAFGPDGYLYMTLGDGGSSNDPERSGQDNTSLLGTIIRIDVNNGDPYAIPSDNPFVNDPNARPEIWSWGWRNPWRFSFDRQTGDMWIADVGQSNREEISFEPANASGGVNYGWRCFEGTRNAGNCNELPDAEPPVFEYTHSSGFGRSVTGGYVYRGSDYPSLKGHYVFGDFISGRMWTLYPSGNGFDNTDQGQKLGGGQITAFGQDSEGELYVVAQVGRIYRITATGTTGLDPQAQPTLNLSPQPWVNELSVTLPDSPTESLEINIYDLRGRQIRQESRPAALEFTLVRGQLIPGVYVLEVKSGSQKWNQKVMVAE